MCVLRKTGFSLVYMYIVGHNTRKLLYIDVMSNFGMNNNFCVLYSGKKQKKKLCPNGILRYVFRVLLFVRIIYRFSIDRNTNGWYTSLERETVNLMHRVAITLIDY